MDMLCQLSYKGIFPLIIQGYDKISRMESLVKQETGRKRKFKGNLVKNFAKFPKTMKNAISDEKTSKNRDYLKHHAPQTRIRSMKATNYDEPVGRLNPAK